MHRVLHRGQRLLSFDQRVRSGQHPGAELNLSGDNAERIHFARVEHCKYLVADTSLCWIGTANWERGYFYNTRNVGVSVKNGAIARLLRRIFLKGLNGPYTEKVKAETVYQPRRHGE